MNIYYRSSSEFLPIGLSRQTSTSISSNPNIGINNASIIPMSSSSYVTKQTATPLLTFTYIIFFLQNVCNPLIYIVSNRAYRAAYYKLLCPNHNHALSDGVTLYRFSQTRDAFEMQSQYAWLLVKLLWGGIVKIYFKFSTMSIYNQSFNQQTPNINVTEFFNILWNKFYL